MRSSWLEGMAPNARFVYDVIDELPERLGDCLHLGLKKLAQIERLILENTPTQLADNRFFLYGQLSLGKKPWWKGGRVLVGRHIIGPPVNLHDLNLMAQDLESGPFWQRGPLGWDELEELEESALEGLPFGPKTSTLWSVEVSLDAHRPELFLGLQAQ